MRAKPSLYPFVVSDGLDDVDIAVANMWIDQYIKNLGMLATVRRIKPIQGKKWSDGMITHWMGRITEMLEDCPPGVYFQDIS